MQEPLQKKILSTTIYGNFKTDLTTLRYGNEKPYITKNIGQAPGSQIGLEVQSRIDDVSRITQMLASKPGFKYLANEALLKQAEVQSTADKAARAKKSVAGAILSQIGGTILSTIKIVGSTIVQVPVNGTGTHFLKGFKTNTYLQNGTTSGFAKLFGAGGVEGAQYALRGETVPGNADTNQNFGETSDDRKTFTFNRPTKHGYDETINDPIPEDSGTHKATLEAGNPIRIPGPQRETTPKRSELGISNQGITRDNTDVKAYEPVPFTNKLSADNPYTAKKQNVTKESRVNLGDQGARADTSKKLNYYWTTSNADPKQSLEIDKINFQDIVETKIDGNKEGRDLIKFRFHVITPDTTRILYFRAFLDSFADNYSGQWNPVKYLGRAEDFQIYSGFQRKISLSFKIAAATRSEMQPLYKKMVYLASATAPTYANSGQFMRGTIVKLTLGDYVYELPGVLNSCNFTWNTEYPWEIAQTEPEGQGDRTMQELPMVLDCNIDFTPIHEFTPETGLKKYFTSGFNRGTGNVEQGEKFFEEAQFGITDNIQINEISKREDEAAAAQARAQSEAAISKAIEQAEAAAAIDAQIASIGSQPGVTLTRTRAFGPITEKQAIRDAKKATDILNYG